MTNPFTKGGLWHPPKGSPEAKAHMARLRAMRGKNPKGSEPPSKVFYRWVKKLLGPGFMMMPGLKLEAQEAVSKEDAIRRARELYQRIYPGRTPPANPMPEALAAGLVGGATSGMIARQDNPQLLVLGNPKGFVQIATVPPGYAIMLADELRSLGIQVQAHPAPLGQIGIHVPPAQAKKACKRFAYLLGAARGLPLQNPLTSSEVEEINQAGDAHARSAMMYPAGSVPAARFAGRSGEAYPLLPPMGVPPNPKPRRGVPLALGATWTEEKHKPKGAFAPGSFRYKRIPAKGPLKAYLLLGCPKGYWHPASQRCEIAQELHVMMRPGRRAGVVPRRLRAVANPGHCPPGVPPHLWGDSAFQAELRAYRKRHGRGPVEIRRIKVPKGFPKYLSVFGTADHAVYDAPSHSVKGKRIHHFGKRGKHKPWLVSSAAAGPKFLAFVGGSFRARPDWIWD